MMHACRVRAGEGHSEQVVPADTLLLAGTAIVEEAVLTGKELQQRLEESSTSCASRGVHTLDIRSVLEKLPLHDCSRT